MVRNAFDLLRDRVPGLPSDGVEAEPDPRDEPARRAERSGADALVAMAEQAVNITAATSPAAAAQVQLMLHTTVADLARPDDVTDDEESAAELAGPGGRSVRVHPSTARRLSCDCPTSTAVYGTDGSVLHLGRKERRIKGRLRRAVMVRDRGPCRAPGCTNPAVQIHHIRHWANGGTTCLPNLISLCDGHHWLVHEGGFTILTRSPGRWALLGPDGQVVEPDPPATVSVDPLPHDPAVPADAVTGEWDGSRLDLTAIPDYLLLGDDTADTRSQKGPTEHPLVEDGRRVEAGVGIGPAEHLDESGGGDPAERPSAEAEHGVENGSAEHLGTGHDGQESGPAEHSLRPVARSSPGFQFSQETIDNWLAANEEMKQRALNGPIFYMDDD